MSRKARTIFSIMLIGSILSTFACKAHNANDTLDQQQQLLMGIGMILEQGHYSPKPIDDKFSEDVFKNFLSELDEEKNLFTQTDIQSLSQYKDLIDDEIHGNVPMQFYPATIAIFKQRLAQAKPLYAEILSKPFDFSVDEMFQPNSDSTDYPADEAAAKEAWRLRLKYRTLIAYNDLLNQKEKAKASDSIRKKTNAQLQEEARNSVKKYYDRYFQGKYNDKNFDVTAQFSIFVNCITHEMDPHSDYFSPIDARSFNEDMSNTFYGIGASLGSKDGLITIEGIITGGAAWKSKKITVGDAILKVKNGNEPPTDLTGYTTYDAVKVIRGSKGSVVTLTMKKASNGSTYEVSMVREEVKQGQLDAKSLIIHQGDKKIGYINLPEFYSNFTSDSTGSISSVDMAKEIKKLKAENIDGMIIDLRYNPGGSLQDVDKIIGYFVPKGPAVQVRNRQGREQQLNNTPQNEQNQLLYTGPLTVIVNEFSASASEIFAAAMQDYNRAIIVGSTSTYGKGTVQNQLPLGKPDKNGNPEYGSLKMTIEKFYRIDGGSTQLKGVASDVVFPDQLETIKEREKDNPTALPWDKINPAQYTAWTPAYNKDSVINVAKARVNKDSVMQAIARSNSWIDANSNAPLSLNLEKYKAREALIKKIADMPDKDSSISTSLNVTVTQTDHDKYYNNPDKTYQDYYQSFLKSVTRDIYIKQTVKIVDDMMASKSNNGNVSGVATTASKN